MVTEPVLGDVVDHVPVVVADVVSSFLEYSFDVTPEPAKCRLASTAELTVYPTGGRLSTAVTSTTRSP